VALTDWGMRAWIRRAPGHFTARDLVVITRLLTTPPLLLEKRQGPCTTTLSVSAPRGGVVPAAEGGGTNAGPRRLAVLLRTWEWRAVGSVGRCGSMGGTEGYFTRSVHRWRPGISEGPDRAAGGGDACNCGVWHRVSGGRGNSRR